jgi:DNA-binding MarR family transcriptional regulator
MPEPVTTRISRDLHILAALTRRILESGVPDAGREGVSFTQVSILKWIESAGPRRAQDVARFLSASAPAATQIIARLRKGGLIRSRRSVKDGRAEDLFLTPRARAIIRRHDALMVRRLRKVSAGVPEARLRAMSMGLESAIGMLLADHEPVEDMCLHCGALESPGCVMREHGFRCPTERDGVPPCGRA